VEVVLKGRGGGRDKFKVFSYVFFSFFSPNYFKVFFINDKFPALLFSNPLGKKNFYLMNPKLLSLISRLLCKKSGIVQESIKLWRRKTTFKQYYV